MPGPSEDVHAQAAVSLHDGSTASGDDGGEEELFCVLLLVPLLVPSTFLCRATPPGLHPCALVPVLVLVPVPVRTVHAYH